MTAVINKLKDKQNVQQLPVTHERAVRDSEGTTLESKLQNLEGAMDKAYVAQSDNGMGRITLKKNIVSGVNTLTQSMMQATNTIYVIRYDFTLGEDIRIPADCVLEFDGGSISAGSGENKDTITGTNTGIQARLVKIFDTNVTLAGSWNITEVYPEWFGAKGDGTTDDTGGIQKAVDMLNLIGGTLKFGIGNYKTNGGHIITNSSANVVGNTQGSGANILHTGTDYCFWYMAAGYTVNLVDGGGFYGLCFSSISENGCAIRLSDRWGLKVIDCNFYNYLHGHAIHVFNNLAWTENAVIKNCMVRNCYSAVYFSKSNIDTATTSCYSTLIENLACAQAPGGWVMILDGMNVYSSTMKNVRCWSNPSSIGGIYLTNGAFLSGYVDFQPDGNAGTEAAIYVDYPSQVNVEGILAIITGINDHTESGYKIKMKDLIKINPVWQYIGAKAPMAIFKGAYQLFGGTLTGVPSDTLLYNSEYLIPYGQYRITIYFGQNISQSPLIYDVYCSTTELTPFITKVRGDSSAIKVTAANKTEEGGVPLSGMGCILEIWKPEGSVAEGEYFVKLEMVG